VPDDPQTPPTTSRPLVPLDNSVQPGSGGHPSAPADDPGTDAVPASPADGQVPPGDTAPPLVEVPSPPYAPVAPLAVDDGPPVPPELDDLLPPPPARRPVIPATAKGTKKGAANQGSEPAVPTPPPWDYGPVTSPAPVDTSSRAAAQPARGTRQEVAAPALTMRPTVKEAARRLTASNARNSLSAMALTIIAGTGWNLVSARRRRSGWY
jgi:hypothetical protein